MVKGGNQQDHHRRPLYGTNLAIRLPKRSHSQCIVIMKRRLHEEKTPRRENPTKRKLQGGKNSRRRNSKNLSSTSYVQYSTSVILVPTYEYPLNPLRIPSAYLTPKNQKIPPTTFNPRFSSTGNSKPLYKTSKPPNSKNPIPITPFHSIYTANAFKYIQADEPHHPKSSA